MATTSRSIVRAGIAAYFGGTYVPAIRGYQGGSLTASGLSTVRAAYPKEMNQQDFFNGLPAGRMSGAVMTVTLNRASERRQAIAGAPVLDGSQNIIAGGIKQINYAAMLDCYHLSTQPHAEDAQADVDSLIEAIIQHIRVDRTLGNICMDAGETSAGIRTNEGHPGQDENRRTGVWFTVEFEVRVNFIA